SESCYFINGKKTVCTSYQATVYELCPWQNSNWTLLIDGKEYPKPINQTSFHKTTSLTQI
ncbi:hypothetical protein ACLPD8_18270, partial [Proteus mirabilis]|uniref:hypothetical protein n=1 Tax=Proteus mirabilis TaxID=584 RepID=UPI003D2807BF